MDLTEAARKTLDEASDLVEVFDSAGKKLDEADDRLEQVERRFEQQWQPLERAGRELLEDIRKLKETLDEEAKRQVAELVGLKGRVTWAKEHGSEVIHATLNEVNAFTQRAKDLDPELDAALDQVEQVGHQQLHRLRQPAIEHLDEPGAGGAAHEVAARGQLAEVDERHGPHARPPAEVVVLRPLRTRAALIDALLARQPPARPGPLRPHRR